MKGFVRKDMIEKLQRRKLTPSSANVEAIRNSDSLRPFIVTINLELTVWLFVFSERQQSQNAANKLRELR